ncbi:hypothetical protein STEG23_031070 [Scotinomys teguina]
MLTLKPHFSCSHSALGSFPCHSSLPSLETVNLGYKSKFQIKKRNYDQQGYAEQLQRLLKQTVGNQIKKRNYDHQGYAEQLQRLLKQTVGNNNMMITEQILEQIRAELTRYSMELWLTFLESCDKILYSVFTDLIRREYWASKIHWKFVFFLVHNGLLGKELNSTIDSMNAIFSG